jgi:hypothetical protein
MNCAFTICAKNYLAQALTLRESFLKHNPSLNFFIFLADKIDGVEDVDGIVALDKSWIPDWVNMAFKYDVIEFNTSIKPFCFGKLFKEGYEKVIYLDPDIYVTRSLDYIYECLNNKSVVLTPHYCDIEEHFDGAVSEETFNKVGIYNLGFCALKNDKVGQEIAKWWQNRLQYKCYSQSSEGLFVDQKWMDYIPGFFPDATCVSSHHGMNVAIWNLHERELFIDEKQGYMIRRKTTGDEFPLLFFHFSGFDPFETTVINRRHPQFNVTTYPSFKPIIEEYRERVYANGYDRFSKMTYGFNHYFDGSVITPLQRRIFRVYLNDHKVEFNPFEINTPFYKILKNSRLLLKASTKQNGFASYTKEEKNKGKKLENKVVKPLLRLALRVLGAERYAMLIRLFTLAGDKEYHYFLFKSTK